jgi:alginate O-acetyltransferase complex protein AlgI
MLFNSYNYILIFFPVVLFFFFFFNNSFTKIILSFFSIIFILYDSYYSCFLLLASLLINFFFSQLIIKNIFNSKRLFFYLSILFNISILLLFKYLNFIINNINYAFNNNFSLYDLAFPLALSFYTIEQVSLMIDLKNDQIKKIKFIDYLVFVLFFPRLIAGPIVLFKQIYPQISNKKLNIYNAKNFYIGLVLFSIGLFKKSFISDRLNILTTEGFDDKHGVLNFIDSWISSIAYTFQIYFDFSAYTEMALGSALMMNIKIPNNFDNPYKSKSLIEFWKRWHITLSNFINYYVYLPILKRFKIFNVITSGVVLILIMFVVGIWHGPSWPYALFGLFHGFGLFVNHIFRKLGYRLNSFFSWIITFIFINLSFVIFRAKDLTTAKNMFQGMFFINSDYSLINSELLAFSDPSGILRYLLVFIISLCYFIFMKKSIKLHENFKFSIIQFIFLIFINIYSIFKLSNSSFIYFSF